MANKNSRNTGSFKKQDGDKNMLELIEPNFILGVGEVLTFGAGKYAPNNWKKMKPSDAKRIQGSLLRHQLAYANGEVVDPETGINHMYHLACNAMFLAWYSEQMEKVATTCDDIKGIPECSNPACIVNADNPLGLCVCENKNQSKMEL